MNHFLKLPSKRGCFQLENFVGYKIVPISTTLDIILQPKVAINNTLEHVIIEYANYDDLKTDVDYLNKMLDEVGK
ncbi:MAG: hypothetical protein DWQ19_08950 [Crenarchaeota archaeon]|nr:MAG: hypothetical protein DWQ19_08950 [Thermoproteota archaeon]